jgi:hypothetical protein
MKPLAMAMMISPVDGVPSLVERCKIFSILMLSAVVYIVFCGIAAMDSSVKTIVANMFFMVL